MTCMSTGQARSSRSPHLIIEPGPLRPRWSYFLRADTMHTLYSYLEDNPWRRFMTEPASYFHHLFAD
jgi:hypothetical protein